GGQLVFAKPEGHKDPEYLLESIEKFGITKMHFVPSMLQVFMDYIEAGDLSFSKLSSLKDIFCSGEALPLPLAKMVLDKLSLKLNNLYGPTEASIDVSFYDCAGLAKSDLASVPIGKSIDNTQLYILNKNLTPCSIGVPGELYIGGVGLARGYLNQEELTKERFITNPFVNELGSSESDRIYKTGDLVRWLPDGNIEYLGRTDFQVKIRGFRIELGEIENVLAKHEDISQVSVIDKEKEGQKYLAAYYVIAKDTKAPEIDHLKFYLSETLPDYMVPAAFVKLDEMPLTPNGKINRRALPEPDMSLMGEEYVAPRNDLEQELADIWSEVLKLDKVGIHDNFFSVGGDSILSIKIVSRVRSSGFEMSVSDLFKYSTIVDLGNNLIRGEGVSLKIKIIKPFELISKEDKNKLPDEIIDAYPIATLQAGMLFHSQMETGSSSVYHDVFNYRMQGKLIEKKFIKVWDLLAKSHSTLVTSFHFSKYSAPLQLVYNKIKLPIDFIDISQEASFKQNKLVEAWRELERYQAFDIEQAPLFRIVVHKLKGDLFDIGFSFHHAIFDGWSVAALFTEFVKLYDLMLQGKSPKISALPIDYKDFVALELKSISSKEDRHFWSNEVVDLDSMILPKFPLEKGYKPKGVANISINLDKEKAVALQNYAKELGVSLDTVFLAVHLRVLSFITGRQDVLSGVVHNGRPEQEGSEKVLGLFLNSLPFRVKVDELGWKDFILSVFNKKQEIYKHRRYPLAEINKLANNDSLFEVLFNYVHFHVYEDTKGFQNVKIVQESGFEETNFPFVFQCHIAMGEIYLNLTYDDDLFSSEKIKMIVEAYNKTFLSIIDDLDFNETHQVLLGEKSKQILIDWNDTSAPYPKDKTIHQLFEHQVKTTPDNIAVIFEDLKLSYKDLNQKSNKLARLIRAKYKKQNKKDLTPDSLIGLCVERSLDMIIGILGILKAGGAYVPLDPDYPQDRLEYMIEDSHEGLIITQKDILSKAGFLDKIHLDELLVIDSDDVKADLLKQSADNLEQVNGPSSLAYVIYTSGSTGKPKGVMLEHDGVINRINWMHKEYGLNKNDKILQKTPFSFDVSV
ncbi:MAG: non-ribosomal peptide synthetase component F/aryl carrier-like protein, partial [Francisellaceae bacterium]